MDTRDRIIDAALDLFSERGYGDVTVAEIAGAVGIRAPSIYKHFGGKREILDAVLGMAEERYRGAASGLGIDGEDPVPDSVAFSGAGEERMAAMVREMFLFHLHDRFESRIRRMLSISRFSDPEMGRLFAGMYLEAPLEYQAAVFAGMCAERGIDSDPRMMALEFYSPVFLLLQRCDSDPDAEEEALEMLERHVSEFGRRSFGGVA